MFLRVADLTSGYGGSTVLTGVDLELDRGEALAVLGRNGVGKTTLINTIMGQTRVHGGRLALAGRDVTRLASEKRARLGLGWVPQERNIFRSLSVEENLTAVARPGAWDVARIWRMFPRLQERRTQLAGTLSGGEQQMLAIGRALMADPKVLLMDEPSMGLAPILVEQVFDTIREIKERGTTIFLVEQNAKMALSVADRGYVLRTGEIVLADTAANLVKSPEMQEAYLGG